MIVSKKKHLYALYKADTFMDIGTKEYLANKIGVDVRSIEFYMSPTYQRRNNYKGWVVIRIEEDEI
jgi:hypothetical protein